MSELKTISVKLLGVSPRDERMIQIVLSRQPSKNHTFVLTADSNKADVALVNTDAENAENDFAKAKVSHPEIIAVYLSNDGHAGEGTYRIAHRSLLFQLVLTLEDIAATMSGSKRRAALDDSATAKAHHTPEKATVAAPAPAPSTAQNSPSQYPQLSASKAPSPNAAASERAFDVGIETMGMFNMRPLTALVVDDSITVRNQLQAALQKAGVTTQLASSGEQALLMLSKNLVDLIFLDVVMPGDDGYAVCKAIRKLPTHKQTQVMMLTSRSSPFDRARGALAGCDMYLIKPIDLKSFYAAVDRSIMKICKNDRSVAASRGYQLSV
jgi:two-component system, cell cycle response regulator